MAAKRDISIYQGDTYVHNVAIQDSSNNPIDISGRVYTGQIRTSPGVSSIVASFTVTVPDPTSGEVQFSLSSSTTSGIPSGAYYYDFQELNGSIVLTLMAGVATVTAEVTK